MNEDLVDRARRVWREAAGVPLAFPEPGGLTVAVAPGSALAPRHWVGIVELRGAAVATVPDEAQRDLVTRALSRPGAPRTDPEAVRALLPVAEVLGPATLAYASAATFRPAPLPGRARTLPVEDPRVTALLDRVRPEEAGESALAEIDSPAFVITAATGAGEAHRNDPPVLAAAGYARWPGRVAHLSVLTEPERRGRGLARGVAGAAVAHALARGLLPQWRARPPASRAVARAVGCHELGAQLSLLLTP